MARPATGTVVEPKGDRKSWSIRFRANGKRQSVTLGRPPEWNRRRAEEALTDELARVRAGVWGPPQPATDRVTSGHTADGQTFHEFAETWLELKMPELRESTIADYRWAFEHHLLPHFGTMPLASIDVAAVDRFKAAKLRERRIGPNQINKCLTRLTEVLELAVEYGHLAANPAAGKRRRVKRTKPGRSHVEVEQLTDLLAGADGFLRPVLATLAGCGLRIGEAVALDWRDIDLVTATIHIGASKTEAGEGRDVDIPRGALGELIAWKARSPRTRPGDPVFVSRARKGVHRRQTKRNVEARMKGAIAKANERLASRSIAAIDPKVSPHSLRRLYASLRAAVGDSPVTIAEQGGWQDPRFVLAVYAKAAKRREKLSDQYAVAFDAALVWAQMGTKGAEAEASHVDAVLAEVEKTASESRIEVPPGV